MTLQPIDPRYEELLDRARVIAATQLSPRANTTDQAARLPIENLRVFAEAGPLSGDHRRP